MVIQRHVGCLIDAQCIVVWECESCKLMMLSHAQVPPETNKDEEADRQLDFVCPFPRCEHKKQYPSKFNLLRHFFIHYPDSEDEYLRCPCCLKLKENLGALSAHWEKSCKRKLGKYDLIKEEERRRLEFFEDKKAEMGVRLTTALNEALFAPRKQARQGVYERCCF
ncbi:hypothetical protein HYQ44_007846 [Verticillium longisporum]|nr:hypothetical protein HYQ44_007846 [Verticillium longisporum]